MQGPTSVEKQRVYAIVQAVEETIKDGGPRGCPLGPLYACLMGTISYNTFEAMIKALVDCKRIKVSNHCAIFVGQDNPKSKDK